MGFSYNTYLGLDLIAPVIFLAMMAMFSVIAFNIARILCMKRTIQCNNKGEKSEERSIVTKIPYRTFLVSTLKLMFAHDLVKEKSEGITSYYIYGRKVGPGILTALFIMVTYVLCCSAITFWSVFLIDESDTCNPNVDCFATNQSDGSRIELSIENCPEYEKSNYTLECFKFVLNYAEAFGHSGGVLVLAKVVVSLNITIWIAISSLIKVTGDPDKYACCKKAFFFLMLQLYIGASLILCASIIFFSLVPFFRDLLFNTVPNILKFIAYYLAFSIGFYTSGPLFVVFTSGREPKVNPISKTEYDNLLA